ncbi:MAG: undecaprenyldiphospho-muramoylpentapeptide beta-N-acetylglucosaminyltransferase [Clostridiales bacterium]|nr:undecaprenyldiphospho-muramoylpentapeptide beta-N-acetylglucosaminyltransferase [Clostridiales bacterium]
MKNELANNTPLLRAVVSGGGTGGHIYPALAIAAALRERLGTRVLYMGGKVGLHGGLAKEEELAMAAGWEYRGVCAAGLSRRSLRIIVDIMKNLKGVAEAKEILRRFDPQVVIGTGGYAMAPTLQAAATLKIPTMLHEQNAIPGWANRYLSSKVDMICLSMPAAQAYFHTKAQIITSGLPVRPQITKSSREEAYKFFTIAPSVQSKFTLLVTGGSQGALQLNEAISSCYEELLDAGCRIIHLTGEAHYEKCYAAAKKLKQENLYVLPYLNDMQYALALADLALARSGASFLAEAAMAGLPTILVPYPYAANNHQTENALTFTKAQAALLIPDKQLNGASVAENVLKLKDDAATRQRMSKAAYTLAKPDALDNIIKAVIDLYNS